MIANYHSVLQMKQSMAAAQQAQQHSMELAAPAAAPAPPEHGSRLRPGHAFGDVFPGSPGTSAQPRKA